MRNLLEIREKVKLLYSRSEFILVPVLKFMLAFLTICMVNGELGYMSKLDNLGLVLIVSLLCSFLPNGCIVLFAAVFSLMHLYELSLEVAIAGLAIYLIMFLLFFRLNSRDSVILIFTVVLLGMKIPYVIPIAVGLLAAPLAAIPVGCGIVVYYMLTNISANATTISSMGADEATAKLRLVIDGILGNRAMLVLIVAFAITITVVYLLRRMSIDYSWSIAMIAGVIIDLVVLLVGDLMYDTKLSLGMAILGSIVALIVGKVLEFFRFCVDYSRTEKVQYEDDEYYYYVKAVPKMSVSAASKTVKHINTQRRPVREIEEDEDMTIAPQRVNRSVVTERTGSGRRSGQSRPYQSRGGSRSVTISSEADDPTDDYEEI
ncbi:MAG: hypothetical protein J6B43_03420 [Lachnospiraceae bacterium]|nr:hypothetical protein [Lachnospiraceae bacterium]